MPSGSYDDKIYSVAEITREIKELLEGEFRSIWVEGEISNYLQHTSGHRYFTLKDETAQIRAVIWRSTAQSLKVKIADGLKVRAFGDITLYEKGGTYQLRVLSIVPVGVGTLEERFQQLKAKLDAEGLFAPERKRQIPRFPKAIGIVTSPTGAAIRDIIHIARRRAPMVRLIIRPTRVQGEGAAEDIARAIAEFNEWGEVDLLIVGRGGGSLEDLWAFNEEIVARAIFSSRIPVISAVGHEIDFSIADFVADLRAPTPSAAAELSTFDAVALGALLSASVSRLRNALRRNVSLRSERIVRTLRSPVFTMPESILEPHWQRVDEAAERLRNLWQLLLLGTHSRLEILSEKLVALSPDLVLQRGYAVVRREADQKVIRQAAELASGERIAITFADGTRPGRVD